MAPPSLDAGANGAAGGMSMPAAWQRLFESHVSAAVEHAPLTQAYLRPLLLMPEVQAVFAKHLPRLGDLWERLTARTCAYYRTC